VLVRFRPGAPSHRKCDSARPVDFRFNCQTAEDKRVRSRGATRPSFCTSLAPKTEGAGNAGRSMRPQPRVRNKKAHELVTTGSPKQSGIPCAMVLTVSFALSLVTGLSCHHRPRDRSRTWHQRRDARTTRLRRPHRRVRPRACDCTSRPTPPRPPHPAPNVRDDRETPLLDGCGMARTIGLIWVSEKQKYFFRKDWTAFHEACPSGKSVPFICQCERVGQCTVVARLEARR
jgi:hypothetical protein